MQFNLIGNRLLVEANEGVYLPRGSLTEQGRTWFTYRGQEIEYYNRNLNGLETVEDLLSIDPPDVEKDRNHKGDLNLTSVDAVRIASRGREERYRQSGFYHASKEYGRGCAMGACPCSGRGRGNVYL